MAPREVEDSGRWGYWDQVAPREVEEVEDSGRWRRVRWRTAA